MEVDENLATAADAPGSDAAALRRLVNFAAHVLGCRDAFVYEVSSSQAHMLSSTAAGLVAGRQPLFDRLAARLLGSQRRLLAVADLTADPLAGSLPTVVAATATGCYLGMRLIGTDGTVLGLLQAGDPEPTPITDERLEMLRRVGELITDHLGLARQLAPARATFETETAAVAQAVHDGEIIPWFQPVIDLRSGDVIGLEALARWQHPSGQLRGPDTFIPTAERGDLIVELDLAVIRRALGHLARWRHAMPGMHLNVNLSGRHLDRHDWVGTLVRIASDSGVPPSSIDLEVTETARPSDAFGSRDAIETARSHGFRVWLDDFGSGWSALQELINLPVDGIKLDRSFTQQLSKRGEDPVIRALVGAAGEMGLRVTIEGVETTEQAALARTIGCDYAQGFLWSPPVPASVVDQVFPRIHDGSIKLETG